MPSVDDYIGKAVCSSNGDTLLCKLARYIVNNKLLVTAKQQEVILRGINVSLQHSSIALRNNLKYDKKERKNLLQLRIDFLRSQSR